MDVESLQNRHRDAELPDGPLLHNLGLTHQYPQRLQWAFLCTV